MVQKTAKKSTSKGGSLKSKTVSKNVPKKSEEEVPLSNGYSDSSKGPSKSAKEKVDIAKKSQNPQEEEAAVVEPEENTEDNVTEEGGEVQLEINEGRSEAVEEEPIKQPQKSRKRKNLESSSALDAKTNISPATKTKSKRQRVFLEIPPLKAIPGKVFVTGQNDVGQLGFDEDVEFKEQPTLLDLHQSIVDIAAGGMHSICLTESGEVITFGCNDEGALGRITSEEVPEYVPGKVEIPEKIVQVSAGDSHSAALSDSGQVYIWGNFRSGDGPMGLTADGAKQMKPIKILNNVTIVSISSGNEHLACLSSDGNIYTLGCGETGQLGRISKRSCRDGGRKGLAALLEPQQVNIGTSSKPVLISKVWTGSYATFLEAQGSGLIYAFGLNNYNHLGYKNETIRFTPKQIRSFNNKVWLEIDGGQHHTLALDNEGIVYALGRDDYGRLGLGEHCGEKAEPTIIPSLESSKCTNISCGNCVSFAISDTGSLYSWGMGTNYQLGHGNEDDCHVPRVVEGNFLNSWKAIKVTGGGQHALILACPRESQEEKK